MLEFEQMENLRKYGKPPYSVAVAHGGPGAAGEAAPVARELGLTMGVLESLQTADTCEGQVQEVRAVLEQNADLPVTLIGHSWGAMLSFMVAARYPSLVKKLIMVSSAVFQDEYTVELEATRLMRLGDEERVELLTLMARLDDPAAADKNELLFRFSQLLWTKADSYAPLAFETEALEVRYDINVRVMEGAKQLRHTGELLELGKKIRCPVVAIHGDHDPHQAAGVREPLERVVKDFRFILLEKCGHFPWLERYARERFYDILKNEL